MGQNNNYKKKHKNQEKHGKHKKHDKARKKIRLSLPPL